jgi:hypothetical protein
MHISLYVKWLLSNFNNWNVMTNLMKSKISKSMKICSEVLQWLDVDRQIYRYNVMQVRTFFNFSLNHAKK